MTEYSPSDLAYMDRNTYRPPKPLPEASKPVEPTKHPLAGRTPGVRSTSRKALKTVNLSTDESAVFTVLKMHDRSLCDAELLDYLRKFTDKGDKWSINQVTGRRNSLMTKGLIEEDARWKCERSTLAVIHWAVAEDET